jgi:hypothetical protein
VTSTVSGQTDQGADPNRLVAIDDVLAYATAAQASGESFSTLQTAAAGEVLRGVSLAPVPLPDSVWLLLSGGSALFLLMRLVAIAERVWAWGSRPCADLTHKTRRRRSLGSGAVFFIGTVPDRQAVTNCSRQTMQVRVASSFPPAGYELGFPGSD